MTLNQKIRIGDWLLDVGAQTLRNQEDVRHLTVKVTEVLRHLAARPGETLSRDELIENVWNGNRFVGQRGLTNAIWQLRQHLGSDAILTISKVGYRLAMPVHAFVESAIPLPRTPLVRGGKYPLVIGTVLLLAAAAFAGMRGMQVEATAESLPRYTQTSLTYFNGVEEYPAFSADGEQLAFAWEQPGLGSRLFVRNLKEDGNSLRQISLGADDEVAPAWDPSGTELAFARIAKDGTCRVFIRSLTSMAERFIDTCAYERYHRILDWSKDGRYLFHTRSGPESGVVSVCRHDLSSGQSYQLTHPPAGHEDKQLAAAPRDARIAFVRSAGSAGDVHVADSDGRIRQVTFTHEPVYGLAWWNDSTLVMNTLRDGRFAILRLDIDSGETALVYRAETPFNLSAVPGKPHSLAFSLHRGTEYVEVLDSATGASETEISSTGRDMYAVYSPRQNRVLFLSTRSGRFEVWSTKLDGREPRQHTRALGLPDLPVWSPDGERFAVPLFRDGRYRLDVFDVATGMHHTVGEGDFDYRNANWYGKENALLVSTDRGGAWNLGKLSLADNSYVELTDDGGVFGQLYEGYLYYTRAGEAGIWRRALAGGPTERLLDDLHHDDWGNWQMTDRGLYYVARERGADDVHLKSLNDGTVRILASFPKNSVRIYRSLSVAGDKVVLTRLGNRQADIVLIAEQP